MSFECTVGNFIALSGLAIKVHTDYKNTLNDYRQISEEALALHILIDKAAQHLKSTAISSDEQCYGRKVLRSCQDVLEELNSLVERYKSLAAINERLAKVKLSKEGIIALQERLISNTVLLNGFVRSCEYLACQTQLAAILGHQISMASIASFAAKTGTNAAYKKFCEDLYQSGVTKDLVRRKEDEILDTLRSQGMVARNTRGQKINSPLPRFTSSLQSRLSICRSSMDFLPKDSPLEAGSYIPSYIPEDISATLLHLVADNSHIGTVELFFGEAVPIDQDKNTLLHCVSRDGCTDIVKLLIRNGAPTEVVNKDNNTPLHLAAQSGHAGVVELLLKKGARMKVIGPYGITRLLPAEVETRGINGDTPLHLAARGGHAGVMMVLFEKGALIEAVNKLNQTPLHLAAQNGHTGLAEVLLGKGALIEARTNQECTPLHFAAFHGSTSMVGLLLRNGASIDPRDKPNFTPLHYAAMKGHTSLVALLIEKGAATEVSDAQNSTPLHKAAQEGHTGVVEVLLRNGASIDPRNQNKNTPLHRAASRGHPEVVEVLLREGAAIEAIGEYGNTPLHSAAGQGHTGIVEVLLRNGASIDPRNEYRNTPLHISLGHIGVVEVLLKEGASVEAIGQYERTPLHFAAAQGYTGVVEVLLGAGASIVIVDEDNMTPLQLAAQNCHTDVVKLLQNQANKVVFHRLFGSFFVTQHSKKFSVWYSCFLHQEHSSRRLVWEFRSVVGTFSEGQRYKMGRQGEHGW